MGYERIINKGIVARMILRDVIRALQNNALTLDDLGCGDWAGKIRGMASEVDEFVGLEEDKSLAVARQIQKEA